MLKNFKFMTVDGLCKFVKRHNIDKSRIQSIVYDSYHAQYVLFYWL